MRRATAVSLFALLCAIWGSTWLVIKVGYGGLGPFNVASLRFLIAGALLVPVAHALGAPWPRGRTEWGLVLFVGLVLFGADYGLIYWGEQWLDSGLTAVLFAVMPLLTAVGAHLYLPDERLTARKLAGTLLALLGVAALFAGPVQALLRGDAGAGAAPMLAILASAVCAAAASLATKRHGAALHPAPLNAAAMLAGGAALAAASLLAGDGYAVPTDAPTWGAILYLAVAGSIVTFLVYFRLLKSWSATTMSFIAVFTPAIALLLGLVFRDERPTGWTGLGAALVLAGVALAVTGGRGARRAGAPEREADA